MHTVTILYFACIREQMGMAEEQITLPGDITRIDQLIDYLRSRNDAGARAFETKALIRAGLDQNHADLGADIGDAREIAFFPPVTGG